MAEELGDGLQNRIQWCESAWALQIVCYNFKVLRKQKGYQRISYSKIRRVLHSNFQPPLLPTTIYEPPENIEALIKVSNSHKKRFLKQFYIDGFIICGICHEKIERVKDLTIDHIIPKSKGGSNKKYNVQPAHYKCNHRKGSEMPAMEVVEKIIAKQLSGRPRPKKPVNKIKDLISQEILDVFGEVEEIKDNITDFLYPK